MSLLTVKCNSCNVVINELLAFLRNVLDVMDEESVHQLCTSSFSAEEIVKAKTLLFESVPTGKKMPVRRKDGKKKMSRDLDDMICLLKGSNPDLFPIFVARELHRLPPVSFDHVDVTRLLKDVAKLQNKVSVLEEKVVTTEQFDRFKLEVENMKHASLTDTYTIERNINKRRGACLQNSITLDSGPIGLEYVPIKYSQVTADSNVNGRPTKNTLTTADQCDYSCVSVLQTQQRGTENSGHSSDFGERDGLAAAQSVSETECMTSKIATLGDKEQVSSPPAPPATCTKVSPTSGQRVSVKALPSPAPAPPVAMTAEREVPCAILCDKQVSSDQVVGDNEWKLVQNKRYKQNRISSQKGKALTAPEGKFRAADIKVPLLISNVSTEASEVDIINYIKDKTSDIVSLKKINTKSYKKYNAYKLYVSKCKLDLFLNNELWPDGIVFRRYVHFMYRTKPQESIVKVN